MAEQFDNPLTQGTWHVYPSRDGGWEVQKSDHRRPVIRHETESGALDVARVFVGENGGGRILLLNEYRKLRRHEDVEPRAEPVSNKARLERAADLLEVVDGVETDGYFLSRIVGLVTADEARTCHYLAKNRDSEVAQQLAGAMRANPSLNELVAQQSPKAARVLASIGVEAPGLA